MQQFAALHVSTAVGQTFGIHRVVTAPGDVHTPHLAVPFTEADFAGEQQRRMFMRRATAAVLGRPRTTAPRMAHWVQLARPSSVERQQLTRMRGQRYRSV